MKRVKFSNGNKKMGAIPSVSLPAVQTCRKGCACAKYCYALRMEKFRKNVHDSYISNYNLYTENREKYWADINAKLFASRFFRFHVSGDIPDMEYCKDMFRVAEKNSHCQTLVFTKQYEIVNAVVSEQGMPSENLHILFSAEREIKMENPYNFPTANILFPDGSTTAENLETAVYCSGNCFDCFCETKGCMGLKAGEELLLNKH